MQLRKLLSRMLSMCPQAWYIWIRTIQLCVVLLFCAVMLLMRWQSSRDYYLYMTAISLNEIVQSLLLIAVLASVLMEDLHGSNS